VTVADYLDDALDRIRQLRELLKEARNYIDRNCVVASADDLIERIDAALKRTKKNSLPIKDGEGY
jgi:hypothetical protein